MISLVSSLSSASVPLVSRSMIAAISVTLPVRDATVKLQVIPKQTLPAFGVGMLLASSVKSSEWE